MVLIFGSSTLEYYLTATVGWILARAIGLAKEGNWTTTDFAFDVLSLQALFLVLTLLKNADIRSLVLSLSWDSGNIMDNSYQR
jgi:hypothetical protein